MTFSWSHSFVARRFRLWMSNQVAEQSKETPLAERLRERIWRNGPMSFRDWMEAALYDQREGYYRRADLARWGRAGDYRTGPERSPLFAATFARYFATLYEELGAPPTWTIIESGAGAGHFAQGVLETWRLYYPRLFSATRYIIDEVSAAAREQIRDRVSVFAGRVEYLSITEIEAPIGEGVVFANELLDAFPVHRVKMRDGRLYELFVGVDDAGAFTWVEKQPATPRLAAYFQRIGASLAEGQIGEVNLEAEEWMARVSAVFDRGYVVTVDYGAEAPELYTGPSRRTGTLRAFYRHQFAGNVLARPGEQDLTTTVDWTSIKKAGEAVGLETVLFERQDRFLLRAGLLEELERMTAGAPGEADALILRASVREMILPGGMSESFQVLVQRFRPAGGNLLQST